MNRGLEISRLDKSRERREVVDATEVKEGVSVEVLERPSGLLLEAAGRLHVKHYKHGIESTIANEDNQRTKQAYGSS